MNIAGCYYVRSAIQLGQNIMRLKIRENIRLQQTKSKRGTERGEIDKPTLKKDRGG